MRNILKNRNILRILGIWVITLLVYLPVFDNNFLNWDDARYITGNPMIRDLSFQKMISFFTSYYDGHYHPLTLLSLALDYKLGGLDPWWFHFTSLLLHLINIALVYFLVDTVSLSFTDPAKQNVKKSNGKIYDPTKSRWIVPAVVALLFALHPVNVESVAWMSERKNVLFTAFFLMSLILYLQYVKSGSVTKYLFSFLLFVIAVLSKVTAVSLVFALITLDYIQKRELLSKKVILEKIPFLVFTIGFIFIGTLAQRHTWGYHEETGYTFLERIPLAANTLLQYFLKITVPYSLSGFYPYPTHANGTVPFIYWLSFIPLIALAVVLWISFKRNKVLAFGLLFFLVNILFLIKLFDYPIGNNKMGDRYEYVPCIGVFMIMAFYLYRVYLKGVGTLRPVILTGALVFTLVYMVMAHERVKIWKSDISLFSDVTEKYPECALAWNNIGMEKKTAGDKRGALQDFSKALEIDSLSPSALLNHGGMLAELGNPQGAVQDFNRLIRWYPGSNDAYLNRAIALAAMKDWNAAIDDYNRYIIAVPSNALAITNRGVAKAAQGKLDSAMVDFTRAIAVDPSYPNAYFNRANAKARQGDFAGAIADYDEAIRLKPDYLPACINRADARAFTKDYAGAIRDYDAILAVEPGNKVLMYKKALAILKSGRSNEACGLFNQLKSMGMNIPVPDDCLSKK